MPTSEWKSKKLVNYLAQNCTFENLANDFNRPFILSHVKGYFQQQSEWQMPIINGEPRVDNIAHPDLVTKPLDFAMKNQSGLWSLALEVKDITDISNIKKEFMHVVAALFRLAVLATNMAEHAQRLLLLAGPEKIIRKFFVYEKELIYQLLKKPSLFFRRLYKTIEVDKLEMPFLEFLSFAEGGVGKQLPICIKTRNEAQVHRKKSDLFISAWSVQTVGKETFSARKQIEHKRKQTRMIGLINPDIMDQL